MNTNEWLNFAWKIWYLSRRAIWKIFSAKYQIGNLRIRVPIILEGHLVKKFHIHIENHSAPFSMIKGFVSKDNFFLAYIKWGFRHSEHLISLPTFNAACAVGVNGMPWLRFEWSDCCLVHSELHHFNPLQALAPQKVQSFHF